VVDLLRQEVVAGATMMVVKVGTRVLTDPKGRLDEGRVCELAEQIHRVMETGRQVVLVSSGAVAAGMGRLGLRERPRDLAHLQAVAAVGQSVLVEAYERALGRHGRHVAQILLTAEDLDHRTRYLNARNTVLTLLKLGAVPVINENDTVAVDELKITFGDNDQLAAMVTNLIRAPLLVLLSDVEGLYDGDPARPQSRVIPTVRRLDRSVFELVCDRSGGLGKGGMTSKLRAAEMVTAGGENAIIAGGRVPDVLCRIVAGKPLGTLILAQGRTLVARKRWIGFTVQPRGGLVLDAGAAEAVLRCGRSLLPIGVVEVRGEFAKGDVIVLEDPQGNELARGLTNYSAADVRRIKGLHSDRIAETLGHCPYQEVVHRDNMVLTRVEE